MLIGPYRFLEPLGRGTFGDVWRVEYCAEGPHMGQFFAAKLSNQSVDHNDITREMEGVGRSLTLRHANLLINHVGEELHGRLLILMELADKTILERWMQLRDSHAAQPLAELMTHMRQAASAIDYLHDHGLVHGGINPEDVLLLNGEVKIADPGPPISLIQQHAQISVANLSKAICMAPERRCGTDVFQSDQYSLAATYVWLRAGQPVVGLDTQSEVIRLVEFLSERESLALEKALSKEPNARYRNCVEFVEALSSGV